MRVVALVVLSLALAGCAVGGHTTTSTVTVTKTSTVVRQRQAPPPGAQNATYFGTIVSIEQVDARRYLLVLRPESFLVGVTADVASAAQQGTKCAPLSCPGVEDDHLVVPAGSRAVTFVLPATTTGSVLTSDGGGVRATKVSAAQLAALVAGAKTPHLIEPLASGVWLGVDVDKVTSFAQQFQP
jgi:hypothetical protein